MPITAVWDNPDKTIMRVTFEGHWDTHDLHGLISEAAMMMDTVPQLVDGIFDFTSSTATPTSALLTLSRMEATHNPRQRLLIVVGANGYIKSLCNIARKLAPKTFAHLRFVDTLHDAYQMITQNLPQPTNSIR